jgi:two-component system, OmpR family, sensor histidine kinase KdpD
MNGPSAECSEFLVSLLTHDISNFNQTSRGYLEMLLEEQMGTITDDQTRALSHCLRQANRIQGLLESVRLILELDRKEIQLEPVDLDETIREVISRVQTEAADREIRVRFLPAKRKVLAEPPLLAAFFSHLLGNAVRHNDSEVVEIDILITKTDDAAWLIRVMDNGDGVPPTKQERLFHRLDNRDMHGQDLGLALVKKLVERWGGQIWLEEKQPDHGAIFASKIPAA